MDHTAEKGKAWSVRKKVTVSLLTVLAMALVVVLVVGNVVYYWWLYFYIDYKRVYFAIENPKLEAEHVVFVGDSITDGCDLARYYPTLHAYNRGIAGATSGDLVRHIGLAAYDLDPAVVVLLIGTNDYQRSRTHSNEGILANYRIILEGLQQKLPDTKVLVQSVYPIADVSFHKHYTYGHGHIEDLNAAIETMAYEFGYAYADVYSLLEVGEEEMNPAYSEDGLHPNDLGYQVISAYLLPLIEALLA